MVVFWNEHSGRPENEGGDETSSPSPQDSPSLMILMFLSIHLTHLRLLGLLDRQIHLDYHQDYPQLLQLKPISMSDDDESAAVEPQRKASPQRQKGKKKKAEVKKPRDLPKAKKRKPMDSDSDDEILQNEPGTSSNTQPPGTSTTSPVRMNIQFTRSIDQYYFDQFTKNIDQYGL